MTYIGDQLSYTIIYIKRNELSERCFLSESACILSIRIKTLNEILRKKFSILSQKKNFFKCIKKSSAYGEYIHIQKHTSNRVQKY